MANDGTARKRRGCLPGCLVFVAAVAVITVMVSVAGNGDDALTAPQSGSSADVMCDTNETGPDTVALGGKRYAATCVAGFPWDDQFADQ